MQKLLYKIQSKPLKDRQRIVYGSAFVVTLLICGVWLTLLQFDRHKKEGTSTASTSESLSPLKSFSSEISNIWTSAKYSVPKQSPATEPIPEAEIYTENAVEQDSAGSTLLTPQITQDNPSTPTKDENIVE